jgi:ribonuclease HI
MGAPDVHMWTDGSANNFTHSAGGWAAILTYGDAIRVVGGFADNATNNSMETMALLGGLRALKKPCKVTVHSDSNYVLTGVRKITMKGKTHGTNTAIWMQVMTAIGLQAAISMEFTRGHSDDLLNNMADEFAGWCARNRKPLDISFNNPNDMQIAADTLA